MALINSKQTVFFDSGSNTYIYDNNSSSIVPFWDQDYEILMRLHNRSLEEAKEELNKESKGGYVNSLIECGLFYEKKVVDYDNVESLRLNSSMCQLLLIITDDCNMRCRYCTLGQEYHEIPKYSLKKMPIEVAIKAVDNYYEFSMQKKEYGLRATPFISFYGGEPLLNFEVIREVVKYNEERGRHFKYGLTTNGTLLNPEISRFLVEHEFSISISLDGDADETNRKRVFSNDIGVFEIVYKNAKKLQQIIKDCNSNLNFGFIACYDAGTDINKVTKFFNKEFPGMQVLCNRINPYETTYYNRFNDSDLEAFNERSSCLMNEFYQNEITGENSKFARLSIFQAMSQVKNRMHFKPEILNVSCIPGSKLAVAADGSYYICERMSEPFVIGNIETGFDDIAIKKIIDSYYQMIKEHCNECNTSGLCQLCYAYTIQESGNQFRFNEQYCRDQKKNHLKILKDACMVLEKNPEAFERRA